MTTERGLFGELLHRRVPQIVGMYVAGTWMAIEICEWVIERFGLSEHIAVYLFVLLVGMLPSAILVGWGHGAPGKDRWTTLEKLFLPLNLVVVAGILWFGVAPPTEYPAAPPDDVATPEKTVEERVVVDETGQEQTFQVARESHYVRAVGFFWPNQTGTAEDDWLSYALPWLISLDLDRSPVIDYMNPYDLPIKERFEKAGYPQAVGEPLSLQLDIAKRRLIQFVVTGSVSREDGAYVLSAVIYDPEGVEIASLVESGADWLAAADRLASAVEAKISAVDRSRIRTDLPIREHVSDSPEALHAMVDGLNALWLENDYPTALANLTRALEIDPDFAFAHAAKSTIERLMGDNASALASIRQALALDHRLDAATKLLLKANAYAIQGQVDTAVRVLEMWTEVQPRSADAHELLAQNYLLVDNLPGAEAAYRKAYELNPEAHDVLTDLANIERMRGNPDQAASFIEDYMEKRPEDAAALRQLAGIHRQRGDFAAARDALERASFLEADDFQSRVALAELELRQANFAAAEREFAQLNDRDLSPPQELTLRLAEIKMMQAQGRIEAAQKLAARYAEVAKAVYPPMVQLFYVGGIVAGLHTELGEIDEALDTLEDMSANLQPPLNEIKHFSRLQVFQEAGLQDQYAEALDAAQDFTTRFQFPIVKPFLVIGEGNLLLNEGNYEAAEEKLREGISRLRRSVLGLDPDVAESPIPWLARALRLGGRLEEAEAELVQQLTRSPFDGRSRLELARVYLDQGKPTAALEQVDRALQQWAGADADFVLSRKARELQTEIQASL
ncbi:MAG: tetratricopeptide repeat protein [Xanthomonadales bacterium]|nr:tetratricopeptide repeat protein [Xanthomonadales bacterium]